MDDLFESKRQERLAQTAPLAMRMSPATLEEFVGQEEILGPGKLLRRAIESDRLTSLIFYGPPGAGKTALARVIARTTRSFFLQLNATASGSADLKRVVEEARERRGRFLQSTILFVDEIHRFNKAQQDLLLPAVEEGLLTLIGATTQNPYFEVNSALLSRSRVFRFQQLRDGDILKILERALRDPGRGLGGMRLEVSPVALEHWVKVAGGDARSALNALELAALTTPPGEDGVVRIGLAEAEDSIQQRVVRYDREGDQHYDVASAFIKSLRGSDPDAALHYLARMLRAGEDPRFIARRMVILAAEDIGLADPRALLVATASAQALELLGLPEARLPLAEAALYLALAPKSNSVIEGLDRASADLEARDPGPVPPHLRDSNYRGAGQLGHGRGYLYPHDYPGHFVEQQYLPDRLREAVFYRPSGSGEEQRLAEGLRIKRQAGREIKKTE